ncbi:hypothetical protein UY3_01206 [Chelonia mydas]|uniref:Uncharacterized protein n=1 Tax=Chelonia mydas TaxID=8469 RepID=M7BUL8_CHEMY|nr:hypothetical protein UY3_01206 [Chelonia mydas]
MGHRSSKLQMLGQTCRALSLRAVNEARTNTSMMYGGKVRTCTSTRQTSVDSPPILEHPSPTPRTTGAGSSRSSRGRFIASSIDAINRQLSSLPSTPVLHQNKKRKWNRRESISCRLTAVKKPRSLYQVNGGCGKQQGLRDVMAATSHCPHWPGMGDRDQWELRSAKPADTARKQTVRVRQRISLTGRVPKVANPCWIVLIKPLLILLQPIIQCGS